MAQELKLNQIKPISYQIDSEHRISIAGIKLEDLAAKYGTPLYLLCEDTIRRRAQAYTQAFSKLYSNHLVLYASKALNCKAMCKIVEQEGLGIDVVSAGELHTALAANFPKDKIFFHGNNKSAEEISMAISNQIGAIILDNHNELDLISQQLKTDTAVNLLIRVTPGIECHTHEYIKTGKLDSKFGFNLDEIEDLIAKILELKKDHPNIHIRGLHAHIGSQIFETLPHKDTCKVVLDLYKSIKDKFGLEFEDLNIGGGLGIKYMDNDDPPEIQDWVKVITDAVEANCKDLDLKPPRILVEPGRSIVGPAGVTIYRVGSIKDIPGIRKYVSIDGGMADNVRPIMYQAEYTAEIDGANKRDSEQVTIAGKYCESGDVLIKDIELPSPLSGDILAIYSTGAYNYSMASNYNRATKPAVLLLKDGKSHVMIEGESLDDLISHDVIPEHLI